MTAVRAEVIGTWRLLLLPLRTAHAEEMAVVLSDPALYTFIGGAPPTPGELRSRYARWVAGSPDPAVSWCNWVVASRADGCLTGTLQATVGGRGRNAADTGSSEDTDGTVGGGDHVAEISWVVGTPWQGRGIATEAARGLVAWLGRQPVRDVVAHVHPEHHASAAVAAAAGLTSTGCLHEGEAGWRLTLRGGGARDASTGPF